MAEIDPLLRLHYLIAGEGERTVVLVHGFPQTSWEWHRVIPALVDARFRVVAPDYRGAGNSWRPNGGYDKNTIGHDIHTLLCYHLRIAEPIALVGHDIGRFSFIYYHDGTQTMDATVDQNERLIEPRQHNMR